MYAGVSENDFAVVQQKWGLKGVRVCQKRQQNDQENEGVRRPYSPGARLRSNLSRRAACRTFIALHPTCIAFTLLDYGLGRLRDFNAGRVPRRCRGHVSLGEGTL